jgi:hypothetical protein
MDGHYFLLADSPFCPLDGSAAAAAAQVLAKLPAVGQQLSLGALADNGVPTEVLVDVLIVELPDDEAVPWLLRPWHTGRREVL